MSLIIITAGTIYGYMVYKEIFSKNTKFSEREVAVYIPTGSSFADVQKIVEPYIEDMERFNSVAEKKSTLLITWSKSPDCFLIA